MSMQDLLSFVTDQGNIVTNQSSTLATTTTTTAAAAAAAISSNHNNDTNNNTNTDATGNSDSTDDTTAPGGALRRRWTWSRRNSIDQARYCTDYEIIKVLGSGGFGKVFQVRNKIDSRIYAMKVIRLTTNHHAKTKNTLKKKENASTNLDTQSKILREAKVWSSLRYNDHVVRYYSAWVEKGGEHLPAVLEESEHESFLDDDDDDDITTTTTTFGENDKSGVSFWSNNDFSGNVSSKGLDSATHKQKAPTKHTNEAVCNLCHSHYQDWEVSFEHWGLIDSVLQPLDLCIPCYKDSIPKHVDTSNISFRIKQVLPDYLYIVMEYCESTLMEAIQNSVIDMTQNDEEKIWILFSQIVQGLAHLHSHGIIHRDLKPANIFVHEGTVRIGDFGLATTTTTTTTETAAASTTHTTTTQQQQQQFPEQLQQQHQAKKSSNIGTFLYQAPEVVATSGRNNYDEKCDIYSLGVILVEIFSNFDTAMERAKVLSNLRLQDNQGRVLLPPEWAQTHPTQAKLARKLLAPEPTARPSCAEILGTLIQLGLCEPSNWSTIIDSQHSQICRLQNEVSQRDEEITRLQNLLQLHGIRPTDS